MAAGVTLQARLSISGALAALNDLGTPKIKLDDIVESIELTPGTDALGKANTLFSDTRTIAASGTEDLDLAGVLLSAFGAAITSAEIVLIYIKAADANTNNVVISIPADNEFVGPFLASADGYVVQPGDFFFAHSRRGWPVVAGTGDLLTITNSSSGTGVTYDVLIVGRTIAA